jgi:glycosyltransferase involved in cell wall biosynthesis
VVATPAEPPSAHRVAVLLSTHNGEKFLPEQLASFEGQTWHDWKLYWRDDASTDGTPRLVADFLARLGPGRSVAVPTEQRMGAGKSFLRLLRAACEDANDVFAFADQDDVWLPEKLALGVKALANVPADIPTLYGARQFLVNADLKHVALSPVVHEPTGFPAALTQNLATGCTLMLNRAAAELVSHSLPPVGTLHDWWSYILVAAAGGRLIFDTEPVVLYRQHGDNVVGAPSTRLRRGVAALRRGPEAFMTILRQNVAALMEQRHLLSAPAREQVVVIARALDGGALQRLSVLRMRGLARQTWLETMVFRLWFMLR